MGRRVAESENVVPLTPANPVGVAVRRPHVRSRAALWGFAFTAAVGFALVNVVDPYSGSAATPAYADTVQTTSRFGNAPVQSLEATGSYTTSITREAISVKEKPKPKPVPKPAPTPTDSSGGGSSSDNSGSSAPAAGTPDPGSAQAAGYAAVKARGWGDSEYNCLVSLWNRESGWNVYAYNAGSGAYGIPQALPGSKMASAGPDWQNSASTQIAWGLGYIQGRYGTPCGAWSHSESAGWY
ncbi:lytic transglycosylase domain-containing protein [Leifsonia sp. NPDC058248]|uniref:aggregation-promoting factor C-terminal-like domain-containing protein n=1 Tax=Leifsonia sp. NPDC058248 TaxID=3346402 RepID=UPI0036DEB98D